MYIIGSYTRIKKLGVIYAGTEVPEKKTYGIEPK